MIDFSDCPEGLREELIGGEFVAMSPAATDHNRVSGNILHIFSSYLYKKPCEPFGGSEFVFLTEKNIFLPDCSVVCDPDKVKPDGIHGAPDLVIEVLSPSTARNDRTRKAEVYAACGVREYWLVLPKEKQVEIYLPEGGAFVLHEVHTLSPEAERLPTARPLPPAHFKCSLFDDLEIALEDIFYRT